MKPTEILNTSNKTGKGILGGIAALAILSWSGLDLSSLTQESSPSSSPAAEDLQAEIEALTERIEAIEGELFSGVEPDE